MGIKNLFKSEEKRPEDGFCVDDIIHLTDPSILAKIATGDEEPLCRRAAVENRYLKDQDALIKAASSDKDANVRAAAIGNPNLTDQTVLIKSILADEDTMVRIAAIGKIADPSVLAKEATGNEEPSVRKAAVKNRNLADQAVLAKVATGDKNASVRTAAVQKLSDQSVLARAAITDGNASVRKAAVERISDLSILAEVAAKDQDDHVRRAAENKLRLSTPAGRVSNAPQLQALLVIFDRDFSPKDPFVNSILERMQAHGKPYREWISAATPMKILVAPRAQESEVFLSQAMIHFRLLGREPNWGNVEYAPFEGTHGISGVIVTLWAK